MVCEAVQQGPGQAFGAEHFRPLIKGKIAGQQGGAAFVTLAEHLEQEFGAGLGERHEAKFVDNQQLVFGQLLLEAQQAFLVPGLDQLVDQGRRRDKADGEAFLAGGQTEAEGDMGLAGAAVAERDDVLAAIDGASRRLARSRVLCVAPGLFRRITG